MPKGDNQKKLRETRYQPVSDKFVEMLTTGLSMKDSARIAGVSEDTIERWRAADEALNHRCLEAMSQFKRIHIENITKAGKKWWAASAWLLERTFPAEYAQRSTVSLEGNVTKEMVSRLNAGRERAAKEAEAKVTVQ